MHTPQTRRGFLAMLSSVGAVGPIDRQRVFTALLAAQQCCPRPARTGSSDPL